MSDLYEEGRRIARGLIEASFPAAAFHHREHVLATAWLLLAQPGVDWSRRLPALIRRYNVAMGGANTATAGYHETLTQFFLREIRQFLATHAGLAPAAACQALLDSPLAAPDYARRFYSHARLSSSTARQTFLPPDLQPASHADGDVFFAEHPGTIGP